MIKSNDNFKALLQQEPLLDYTSTQKFNGTTMMSHTREPFRPQTKATFRATSQTMGVALYPYYNTEHCSLTDKLTAPKSARYDINSDQNKIFSGRTMKLRDKLNEST